MKVCYVFSLESPQWGEWVHTIYRFQYIKENHPKLFQICSLWDFSQGLKNEFETAVVYEPPVFEPLKFYCILQCAKVTQSLEIDATT